MAYNKIGMNKAIQYYNEQRKLITIEITPKFSNPYDRVLPPIYLLIKKQKRNLGLKSLQYIIFNSYIKDMSK